MTSGHRKSLHSPLLTKGDPYANFKSLSHSRSPFKMDRFLAIGSEDVECQYASLEQINSNRKKKKHQNVVEETRRKSGFDALRFPV